MKAPHLARGESAERMALGALKSRGLKLIRRNYRCKAGEIDLICDDGGSLVFVEVRYRGHTGYGGAAETIGSRKQAKLIRAAQHFLLSHSALQDRPMRFDVIAIEGQGTEMTLNWIPDAFQT